MSEFQHICLKRVAWPRGVRKTWTPYWSRSCDLPPQISNGDSKTFAPHLSTSSQRVNSEICQSHLVIWGCELTSCRIAPTQVSASQSNRKLERANAKRQSKRVNGAVAMRVSLKHTYGIDTWSTTTNISQAIDEHRTIAATRLLLDRTSRSPLPSYKQRQVFRGRANSLPAENKQGRPCDAAWKVIDSRSVPVPRITPMDRSTGSHVRVVVSSRHRMTFWSPEHAIMKLSKCHGTIHVVRRSLNDAPDEELGRVRLVPATDSPARAAELDLVRAFSFTLPHGWARKAVCNYRPLHRQFGSAFHMRQHPTDERRHQAVTVQLGWSAFEGSAEMQAEASSMGVPYKLVAWESTLGRRYMDTYVQAVLPRMWEIARLHYPSACARMWDVGMASLYGLCGTGFNKVTLAINNPTLLHCDGNYGITAQLVFGLPGCVGGTHALFSTDLSSCVLIEHTEMNATLIIGDYASCLHANFATLVGERFVLNAYCSQTLVNRISK